MDKNSKISVLFICTHNSCRSHIAEGILNSMFGSRYKGFSAGLKKTQVNPYAVEVMKEIGIDLSMHSSKTLDKFSGEEFDIVVTVCDNARENCPFFPGKKVIHKSFKDPSEFEGSIEDTLEVFRETRDEIKSWIFRYFS